MKLDIRYPLGFLFVAVGGLLAAYGLWRHIRIDLWWGLVQAVFGVVVLALARMGSAAKPGQG
ncbi:MAG TPA: hypothetical protein VII43_07205 [Opitutaceae bacterium]